MEILKIINGLIIKKGTIIFLLEILIYMGVTCLRNSYEDFKMSRIFQ